MNQWRLAGWQHKGKQLGSIWLRIWWSGDFSKEVRFGDCHFSRGELMKTLIMEEKYSKGMKIGTLFWLGWVFVTRWAAVKYKQGIGRNLENKNCRRAHRDCAWYPKDPMRYCNEATGARRRRVFRWSLEQRPCEKLYNRKSLMLLMKTTHDDLSNACKDGKMSCCGGT